MFTINTQTSPRRIRLGLLWRILLASLFVGLLPLLLISYTALDGYRTASEQATDSTKKVLDEKSTDAQLLRTEDTAKAVSRFLEERVGDLRTFSLLPRDDGDYLAFYQAHQGELWYRGGTNDKPEEKRAFFPLYREVAYIGNDGQERVRIAEGEIVLGSALRNVSNPANTTFLNETYFQETIGLPGGEIYVSPITAWHVRREAQLGTAKDSLAAIEGTKYEAVVRFARPVYDAAGKVDGMVMLTLDHRHLMEFVLHIVPTDDKVAVFPNYRSGNYAWMFDNEGWQIAHPNYWGLRGFDPQGQPISHVTKEMSTEEKGRHPFNLKFGEWAGQDMPKMYAGVLSKQTGLITFKNQAGTERAVTFAPILFPYGRYKEAGVFGGVTVGANTEEFHKAATTVQAQIEDQRNTLQLGTIAIIGAALALVLALSVLQSRGITRPLHQLAGVARTMEKGELDSQTLNSLLARRVEDEVTKLTQVFKQMGEQVQLREKKLKEQIVELHIQIDEQKRREQVSEITDTEYFQNLRANVSEMRDRARHRQTNRRASAAAGESASEAQAASGQEPQPAGA